MADAAWCPNCKANVGPVFAMGTNMRPERVCPGCAYALPEPMPAAMPAMHAAPPAPPSPMPISPYRAAPPVPAAAPPELSFADLPRMIRERQKYLRTEIARLRRDAQTLKRELDQLDAMAPKRAQRRPGTVTPIRRGGSP